MVVQIRSIFWTVRSFRIFPVFNVDEGSKRRMSIVTTKAPAKTRLPAKSQFQPQRPKPGRRISPTPPSNGKGPISTASPP